MKTNKEIPQEIRERIFALYWGQEVLNGDGLICPTTMRTRLAGDCLLLNNLSQITDEDAIEVAQTCAMSSPLHNGKALMKSIKLSTGIPFNIHPLYYFNILDFLRSRGYALPAYGYSVEELVEAGVFKIKEVTNG